MIRATLLALACLAGCSAQHVAVVPELGLAYFGSVATHEAGHALAAWSYDERHVSVSVLPAGGWLGETTFASSKPPSSGELLVFNVSSEIADEAGHVATRAALRLGLVPETFQPLVQWFSLAVDFNAYLHGILGLVRARTSDLGREPVWISVVLLATLFAFDLCDILTDDPSRYFLVLFGDARYETVYPGVGIRW